MDDGALLPRRQRPRLFARETDRQNSLSRLPYRFVDCPPGAREKGRRLWKGIRTVASVPRDGTAEAVSFGGLGPNPVPQQKLTPRIRALGSNRQEQKGRRSGEGLPPVAPCGARRAKRPAKATYAKPHTFPSGGAST